MGTACPYSPPPWTPVFTGAPFHRLFPFCKGAGGSVDSSTNHSAAAGFPVSDHFCGDFLNAPLLRWGSCCAAEDHRQSWGRTTFPQREVLGTRDKDQPPQLGKPGAPEKPHKPKFCPKPGPSGPGVIVARHPLSCAGTPAATQGMIPVNGVRGKANMGTECPC